MKKQLPVLLLMILSAACGHSPDAAAKKDASAVTDGNIATRTTVKDSGVLIDYTDTKKGDTVLLFVHGWAINKNCFANQITYFQDRYRVVTIDLPGYGESGKNRNSWSVPDFGRDVDSVMNELNLGKVILIGHSMSGDIVLDAALHDTQRVLAIVGIDNFKNVGIPESPKDKKDFQTAIAAMKKNFTPVVSGYFEQALFSKDTDSSIRKQILTDVSHTDTSVAVATMEAQDYDETGALKRWHRPLYLVNSNYTPTDTVYFHKMGLPVYLAEIPRSGHFPMVEQPQVFNQALQQTIHLIGAGKAGLK